MEHLVNRRSLLALAAAVPLTSALPRMGPASAAEGRTFVLVHGAFHGGWCWSPVAEILRSNGHRVFTPTFTGVGERAHLMNPNIDLDTFIRDVSAVIECEELDGIVLVGHSFGGYVVSGVAERMADRIASLVYLDGPIGTNGKSVLDEAPDDVRKARLAAAIVVGDTKAIAPPSSTAFGLSEPADVAWVDRRMTPMPLKAYQTPVVLKGAPGGDLPKRFIRCTTPALPNIEPSARYARENGWGYAELATGHDAMVSMPREVAAMLMAS
jgi:pimeloyl-ACP methyl ester carboxylesterase